MKKSALKKFLSIVLVFAIAFSFPVGSFAEYIDDNETELGDSIDMELGMSIKRVEVMNSGAVQAVYRDGRNYDVSLYTVYKGDDEELAVNGEDPDKYYTTARNPNHQDPRTFTVEIVIPKGDYTGIGSEAGEFDPAGVSFSYNVGTSSWNALSGNGATNSVTGAEIVDDYIVITGEVRFATTAATSSNSNTNTPYSPYCVAGRPSSTTYTRIGTAPLKAIYGGETIGSVDLKMSVNDSHFQWYETDEFAKEYIETYGADGGTDYSAYGRYMRMESFGKTDMGRDIWASIIADSKESVDEYLNVTRPLMNSDPAKLQSELAGGNQKSVLLFNAIHGNEIEGNGVMADMRERLLQKETLRFTKRNIEDTYQKLGASVSSYSQDIGRRVTSGKIADNYENVTDLELNVDDFLDKYIVVIVYYSNADGNSAPLRYNNYGSDPNRDGGIFAYKETRAMSKALTKWDPIYTLEFHDNVQTLLIDATTPPMEPSLEADLIDDYMLKLVDSIGMSAIGLSAFNNYFAPTRDVPQAWDNGAVIYTPAMSMMCGSLGSTMEFPNNTQDAIDAGLQGMFGLFKYCLDDRDNLFSNKLEFKVRGVENIDAKDSVDPLLTNIHKLVDENRAAFIAAGCTTIPDTVQQPRPRTKDEDGNERSFFPEYYIFPVDKDLQSSPSGAVEALTMLQDLGGVEIERTTEAVTTSDGVTYPAGTYVIGMYQAHRTFANTLLYPGFDASIYGSALYDGNTIISWPGMKGFNCERTWEKDIFKGKTESVNLVNQVELPGDGEYVIYNNSGHDAVRLTNRLLNDGKDAWMVTGYVPGAALGDIVARRADVLDKVSPMENVVLGQLALSVFGVDGGDSVPANTKKLVKPIIATSYPSNSSYPYKNEIRYAYDLLEFYESNFDASATGAGSVYVGTSATTKANTPQFLYGVAASAVNSDNALGTGAVTATSGLTSQNEMLGRGTWSGTSIVASNYGLFNQLFAYNATKYSNLRSDIKPLATFSTGDDLYLSGRKGVGSSGQLKGAVMAVSGVKSDGTGVTAINESIFSRDRYQATWCLMANSIFAYAAGITDVPRPVATATPAKTTEWKRDVNVDLEFKAEDTAGTTETLIKKMYKITTSPIEPAYSPDDTEWKEYVDSIQPDTVEEAYIHWYAENSAGVSNQGTFGSYAGRTRVAGFTLNSAASATLIRGKTLQLQAAKIAPIEAAPTAPAIVWSSSNAKIAVVSEAGLVRAVATGTVVITATITEDGKELKQAVTIRIS